MRPGQLGRARAPSSTGCRRTRSERSSRRATPRSSADTSSCIESDCRSNSTTSSGRSTSSKRSCVRSGDDPHLLERGGHMPRRRQTLRARSPCHPRRAPRRLRPRSRSSRTLREPGTPPGLRTSTEPARPPPGIGSDPPARRRRRRAHARRCPEPLDRLPTRRCRRSIRTRPVLAASPLPFRTSCGPTFRSLRTHPTPFGTSLMHRLDWRCSSAIVGAWKPRRRRCTGSRPTRGAGTSPPATSPTSCGPCPSTTLGCCGTSRSTTWIACRGSTSGTGRVCPGCRSPATSPPRRHRP